VKIEQVDGYLDLWDSNKLEILWRQLHSLSHPELAFVIAWMTTMIRDDGEVKLSQWVVWLETKSNNQ
jgi:hypothetical protein|tara:strand:+ start:156 stop:356 length:201 start_codon:yes stop_codon:yes gene_type:complete